MICHEIKLRERKKQHILTVEGMEPKPECAFELIVIMVLALAGSTSHAIIIVGAFYKM